MNWKAAFPAEWAETPIRKNGQVHIADIVTPNHKVIEFQHSAISPDEIHERELFYGDMLWVFDISACIEQAIDGTNEARFQIRKKMNFFTFRWKHPRKHVAYTRRDCYLDMGDGNLFFLKKMYLDGPPYGGWGHIIPKKFFISAVIKKQL